MIKCAFFALSLIISTLSFAQRVQDWLVLGDRALDDNDPIGALRYYQNAMNLDSSKAETQFKYAEALRQNHSYKKAAYYYYKVYRKEQARIYPLSGFWLAMMQKQSGNYDAAKQTFRRVRNQFEEERQSYYYQKAVQEMRSCDFAELWMDGDKERAQIKPVDGVAYSGSSEFDGKFFANGSLLFTSLRGDYDDDGRLLSENYISKIYLANSSFSELLQVPEALIEGIGFAASKDSSYSAVVQQTKSGNKITVKKGTKTIAEIPSETTDSSWYSHPAFGEMEEEQVLFFSSDMEGGKGRQDIWYVYLKNPNEYINAGELINTPGSEITPFFRHRENELYFSSDWHYGMGGYDIFSAQYAGNKFGISTNLKPPFNTSHNDLYYSFSEQALKGSITSNRVDKGASTEMGCCNNLFYFEEERESNTPLIASLKDLNKYLPVSLYFHNDEPDPKTRDTTTTKNYIDTYYKYINLIPEYEREYSKGLTENRSDLAEEKIDQFFIEQVDQGVSDLELFTSLLSEELKKGSRVEVTVRGFASPLAETDYNVNLTSRRISSLINYLKAYRGGELLPYLLNSSDNGGFLKVIKIPFGEYAANKVISDNPNESNAIYSIGAALERKIEIVSVQQSAKDSSFITLDFTSEIANLGTISNADTLTYRFHFSANDACIIDTIYTESSAISISEFHRQNNRGYIEALINPLGSKGQQRHRIFIEGNFAEEKKELNITFEINE